MTGERGLSPEWGVLRPPTRITVLREGKLRRCGFLATALHSPGLAPRPPAPSLATQSPPAGLSPRVAGAGAGQPGPRGTGSFPPRMATPTRV